jgi:multiple sugar transport system permease protein
VAPAGLVIVALFAYPVGYLVYLSLHSVQMTIPGPSPYVGAGNFVDLVHDPDFTASLLRGLYFTTFSVCVGLPIALGLAGLLAQDFRGKTLARVLLFVPWACPDVVTGITWQMMYNPTWGIIDVILRKIGLIHTDIQWLGTPSRALFSAAVANLWMMLPFVTLVLMAGIQNVGPRLLAAARVDGANGIQRFLHISLPSMRASMLIAVTLLTIWSWKAFGVIYVLTTGGPAQGSTTLNYYTYLQGFNYFNMGEAAAIGIVMAVIAFAALSIYMVMFRDRAGRVGVDWRSRWRSRFDSVSSAAAPTAGNEAVGAFGGNPRRDECHAEAMHFGSWGDSQGAEVGEREVE